MRYCQIVCLSCLYLSLLGGLNATHAQRIHHFGIQAGPSVASVINRDGSLNFAIGEVSPRLGIQVGFFAEWLDGEPLSLYTAIAYVQRGFRSEIKARPDGGVDGDSFEYVTASTRFDYLSFPVLFRYHPAKSRNYPSLHLGPRVDFLLHRSPGRFEFSGFTYDLGGLTESLNVYVVGFTGGIGMAFKRPFPIQFFLHYNYELPGTWIREREPTLDFKNHALDFLISYRFKP